ncbi:MAG: SHOCT domain-containing protein [Acidimicrobiales bacterium]
MYRFGPGFHHGPGVFGWFVMAALLAMLALGVVALVRYWSHPHPRMHRFGPGHAWGPPPDPALNELRVRYARGEISPEEFARRAADLGYPIGPPQQPPPTV